MKIQKSIANRVSKTCKLKPEIATPFYQGNFEYVTNTFWLVKVPADNKIEADRPNTPDMQVAFVNASPNAIKSIRLDIEYLKDMLAIMEDNGTTYLDLSVGDRSVECRGYNSSLGTKYTGTGLIMGVTK